MHTDQQAVLDRLRLDTNGVPIYVQLRDQFLSAIGEGRLNPGAQMPTMRQVAVALKVDLNTVRHAYGELERQGAIVIVRAKGTYVTDAPPVPDPRDREHLIEELALRAIADARTHGVEPMAVVRRIQKIIKHRGD